MGSNSTDRTYLLSNDDVNKYFALREIEGISHKWWVNNKRWINQYLDFVNWKIDENKTIQYCKLLKNKLSISYYRKRVYQVKKYLTYLKIDWADDIKLPPEPEYLPHRISRESIGETIRYFKDNKYFKQLKAIILLGASSGIRAAELYQLHLNDINLDKRMICVNHNPSNGQTTKTKKSRVAFFDEHTKKVLDEYLTYFVDDSVLKKLFSKTHISSLFKDAPIQVKDLRKYFSQEWDRRGGPTSIKKILMGHSLKGDVDLMHYNAQSEDDLKKIYDKIMEGNNII